MIFISHASADGLVAQRLARRLEASAQGVTTFVASRAGDIRAESEWLPSVQKALRESDAYLILLSPNSVLRPWVSFETGAAWFSNKTCLLVGVGALTPAEVPLPLSGRQIYSLSDPHEAEAIFASLDLTLTSPQEFVIEIADAVQRSELVGEDEPSWEGIELGGIFYAWAGPLMSLEDKASTPCPGGLLARLRDRGLAVRWANPNRLAEHFGKGRSQVYATDRKKWRRPVVKSNQVNGNK
jgi:hypothetical protein